MARGTRKTTQLRTRVWTTLCLTQNVWTTSVLLLARGAQRRLRTVGGRRDQVRGTRRMMAAGLTTRGMEITMAHDPARSCGVCDHACSRGDACAWGSPRNLIRVPRRILEWKQKRILTRMRTRVQQGQLGTMRGTLEGIHTKQITWIPWMTLAHPVWGISPRHSQPHLYPRARVAWRVAARPISV